MDPETTLLPPSDAFVEVLAANVSGDAHTEALGCCTTFCLSMWRGIKRSECPGRGRTLSDLGGMFSEPECVSGTGKEWELKNSVST